MLPKSLTREDVVRVLDQLGACDATLRTELKQIEGLVTRLPGEKALPVAVIVQRDLEQYRKELGEARMQLAQVTEKYEELKRQHDKGS